MSLDDRFLTDLRRVAAQTDGGKRSRLSCAEQPRLLQHDRYLMPADQAILARQGSASHDAEAGAHLLCPDLADKPARLNHYRQWIEAIIGSSKASSPSKRTAGASSPGSTPTSPPGSLPRPWPSGTTGASTHPSNAPYHLQPLIDRTHSSSDQGSLVVGQSRPA